MAQAGRKSITPRSEPEVLAADVSAMLAPFFGRDLGPAPIPTAVFERICRQLDVLAREMKPSRAAIAREGRRS